MYDEWDVIEMGPAQELIQGLWKDWFVFDESDHLTFWVEDPWGDE